LEGREAEWDEREAIGAKLWFIVFNSRIVSGVGMKRERERERELNSSEKS